MMTGYFSDREFGPRSRINQEIDLPVWTGLLSMIQTRITNGSLAYGFPSRCPDGNALVGTDEPALWAQLRLEVPEVFRKEESWSEDDPPTFSVTKDFLPATIAVLDLLEFIARNIAEPHEGAWHGYFSHHHISVNRTNGLSHFVEDINRVFSRSGLAFEMEASGNIRRTVSAPLAELISRSHFLTGDQELDRILNVAVDRFLSPRPGARQDAIEKIWDGFERLKTIEPGPNKKAQAQALVDRALASSGTHYRVLIEGEFKVLTDAGNQMMIRHSEVGRETVESIDAQEYLFMRMFSLIQFVLNKTGRLAGTK